MSQCPERTSNAARVLVIDDDELTLGAVAALLLDEGYEVVRRTTGVGAAAAALREGVRAVVCDLCMQPIAGDLLIAEWRKTPALCDLPVILISGHTERLERALTALPGVMGVPKEQVHRQLLPTLARVLRDQAPHDTAARELHFLDLERNTTGSRPGADLMRNQLRERFLATLTDRLDALTEVLHDGSGLDDVAAELHRLREEASFVLGEDAPTHVLALCLQLCSQLSQLHEPSGRRALLACLEWLARAPRDGRSVCLDGVPELVAARMLVG